MEAVLFLALAGAAHKSTEQRSLLVRGWFHNNCFHQMQRLYKVVEFHIIIDAEMGIAERLVFLFKHGDG